MNRRSDERMFVKRNYHRGDHTPFRNMVHLGQPALFGSEIHQGERLDLEEVLDTLLEGLPDGAVFTLSLDDTGLRVDGRMELTAPGVYSLIDGEFCNVPQGEDAA